MPLFIMVVGADRPVHDAGQWGNTVLLKACNIPAQFLNYSVYMVDGVTHQGGFVLLGRNMNTVFVSTRSTGAHLHNL